MCCNYGFLLNASSTEICSKAIYMEDEIYRAFAYFASHLVVKYSGQNHVFIILEIFQSLPVWDVWHCQSVTM